MALIGLTTNVAALQTQRALAWSTAALAAVQKQLSSGLRINGAADDAAGLAISESLNVESRVLQQGVRNLNDGASTLAIAEGALEQLSTIVLRQRELASQAANGSLSRTQRVALDQEARALTDEYNRIVLSTSFNGKLLISEAQDTIFQAGYGSRGSIAIELGGEFERSIGLGTFTKGEGTISAPNTGVLDAHALADLNRDGRIDAAVIFNDGSLRVSFGNGDGTFDGGTVLITGLENTTHLALGDLNSDGLEDVVTIDQDADRVVYSINNGNGTFSAPASYALASGSNNSFQVQLADMNNDDRLDIITGGWTGIRVALNGGNGSFSTPTLWAGTDTAVWTHAGDFNGDGKQDIAWSTAFSGLPTIFFGDGAGYFSTSTTVGTSCDGIAVGDFNHDGIDDIAGASTNILNMHLGTAAGSFATRTFASGTSETGAYIKAADLNADGNLDITFQTGLNPTLCTYFGNGDGSLKSVVSTNTTVNGTGFAAGDLNGDGVNDLLMGNPLNIVALLADTTGSTTEQYVNLTTRQSAKNAMQILDDTLRRLSAERGAIGSFQSRISSALSSLQQQTQGFIEARSRIVDIDVAESSAALLRLKILQQAGTSILAQAIRAPELALSLL